MFFRIVPSVRNSFFGQKLFFLHFMAFFFSKPAKNDLLKNFPAGIALKMWFLLKWRKTTEIFLGMISNANKAYFLWQIHLYCLRKKFKVDQLHFGGFQPISPIEIHIFPQNLEIFMFQVQSLSVSHVSVQMFFQNLFVFLWILKICLMCFLSILIHIWHF